MAKKILLIESDGAFAQELSAAIEARGLEARVVGDGKEALDLARVDRPDAIVLCVELPKMSGYSVCNKLKKDDDLKSIPLVITSAEATSDTFEQHRKLKTHAEDYLIKPFAPADLLKSIAALVALPEEAVDDEVVTLEDVEELEALGAAALETTSEAAAPAAPDDDDDLKLLDEAFNSLAGDDATAITALDAVLTAGPAAAAPPPPPPPQHLAPEAPPTEVGGLGDEAEAALAALGADDEADVALAALGVDVEADAALAALGVDVEADAALTALGTDVEAEVDLAEAAALLEDDPAATGEDLLRQAGIELDLPAPAAPSSEQRGVSAPPATSDDGAAARVAALEHQLVALQAALAASEASATAAEEARCAAESELRAASTAAEAIAARAEQEEDARRLAEQRAAEAEARVAAAETAVRTRADEAEARVASAVRRAEEAEARVAAAVRRADEAESRVATAVRRADEAERQLADVGREAGEAREEAARLGGEAAQARERAEALATELGRVQARAAEQEMAAAALRPEVEQLRGELVELRSVASAHAEVERALTEREKRIADLESQNAKHEERVVKAYQKLKNDEKLRDKARKALAIAQQLLEERSGAPAPADVPPRRE